MKVLEEKDSDKNEIDSVMNSALECLESAQIESYLSLWWQFVLFYKRRLQKNPTDDCKEDFRGSIRRVVKHIDKLADASENTHALCREFEFFAAKIEATFWNG